MARDNRNERVELEMKIMKYRSMARAISDDVTAKRIKTFIAELEQNLKRSTNSPVDCGLRLDFSSAAADFCLTGFSTVVNDKGPAPRTTL